VALEDLRRVSGSAHARPAGPADAIDGVPAGVVIEPGSVDEAREVLRLARAGGAKVVPRGGGTKMTWGAPPSGLDLILSTARLDRLVEHVAGDLVVTAEAGLPLRALQRALAPAGQRLALDPPQPGATVGGVVAAGASGPRRLRFGSVRDLLIGLTVVLSDGTVSRAGGKVVKNVAGYDLCKLFTGSLGTLGLVVQATFRLHPVPAAQRTVRVEIDDPDTAGSSVQVLLHSALVPSAIELGWPSPDAGGTLGVLFEGVEEGVVAQARTAAELAGRHGTATVLDEATAERLWTELALKPVERGGGRVRVGFPPAQLPQAISAALEAGRRHGLRLRLAGHAGSGILFVDLPGAEVAAQARVIEDLRGRLARANDGSVVVLDAPPALKAAVDVWGDPGDALPLMRRVKERFDPERTLCPGRFVGGL
jgi:glycolate oxidase FAD binding subunit